MLQSQKEKIISVLKEKLSPICSVVVGVNYPRNLIKPLALVHFPRTEFQVLGDYPRSYTGIFSISIDLLASEEKDIVSEMASLTELALEAVYQDFTLISVEEDFDFAEGRKLGAARITLETKGEITQ